jgi:hypothetical protein
MNGHFCFVHDSANPSGGKECYLESFALLALARKQRLLATRGVKRLFAAKMSIPAAA